MPSSTYFIQECPVCGRRLEIRVEYLGKRLTCRHCQGQFTACDPASSRSRGDIGSTLLRRADELLRTVSQRQTPGRVSYPR